VGRKQTAKSSRLVSCFGKSGLASELYKHASGPAAGAAAASPQLSRVLSAAGFARRSWMLVNLRQVMIGIA